MSENERLEALEDKLNDLLDALGKRNGRGKRDREEDEDRPRSVHDLQARRRGDPLQIEGVLMPVSVEVGRHGDTISGYVLLPPVRDERELEEVADEFEREFRCARLYQKRDRGSYGGNGNGGGNYNRNGGGGGYNRNGGGYSRGNDRGRDVVCHICRGSGHYANECPSRDEHRR